MIPGKRFHSILYSGTTSIALICVIWAGQPVVAQMSPEEHASHHPEAKPAAPTAQSSAGTGAKPDAMSSMGGASVAPASPLENSPGMGGKPEQVGGMGGAGGMGAMMKGMMGTPPQKELYPSLMALPVLPQEQRLQLQQQAEARVKIGTALLQQGTARMANPAANDTELQEGAADARAGLQEMESGQAAQRALADGHAPQPVALQWFQTEMNLASSIQHEEPGGILGVTPFHLFTMVLLITFALAMVVMYFFKMRRAAALFGRLDSDSGSAPGASPPLAGTPGPSAVPVPGGEIASAKK